MRDVGMRRSREMRDVVRCVSVWLSCVFQPHSTACSRETSDVTRVERGERRSRKKETRDIVGDERGSRDMVGDEKDRDTRNGRVRRKIYQDG